MLWKQILLLGNKKCFCLESKTFFASRTQILRPKHMFPSLATPGNITRNIVSATMFASLARPQEITTAMTTTTSQIRGTIGWIRKDNHAARAVHFLVPQVISQWFDWFNEEKQSCGTPFGAILWWSLPNDDVKLSKWGSDNKATYIRKDFILCLYVKTVRSMRVKRRFAYLLQSDIHRSLTKNWTYSEVLFESDVLVGAF